MCLTPKPGFNRPKLTKSKLCVKIPTIQSRNPMDGNCGKNGDKPKFHLGERGHCAAPELCSNSLKKHIVVCNSLVNLHCFGKSICALLTTHLKHISNPKKKHFQKPGEKSKVYAKQPPRLYKRQPGCENHKIVEIASGSLCLANVSRKNTLKRILFQVFAHRKQ